MIDGLTYCIPSLQRLGWGQRRMWLRTHQNILLILFMTYGAYDQKDIRRFCLIISFSILSKIVINDGRWQKSTRLYNDIYILHDKCLQCGAPDSRDALCSFAICWIWWLDEPSGLALLHWWWSSAMMSLSASIHIAWYHHSGIWTVGSMALFLVAYTPLFKSLCRSVRPSVGRSCCWNCHQKAI